MLEHYEHVHNILLSMIVLAQKTRDQKLALTKSSLVCCFNRKMTVFLVAPLWTWPVWLTKLFLSILHLPAHIEHIGVMRCGAGHLFEDPKMLLCHVDFLQWHVRK